MSAGDNLHVPPVEAGTLVFAASGGVTSLPGYPTEAAAPVLAVSRTHLSTRHAGHPAARHHAAHHAVHHPHARSHKLHLAGEYQPF